MTLAYCAEKQRLDRAFKLAEKLAYDDEMLAHWARYLTVLTSGLIESCVREILSDFIEKRAAPPVVAYARHHVQALSNLNEEKLKTLLGIFSPAWREAFEVAVTDEQKAAIDSIIANRHNIAHGREVGITLARVRSYYASVVQVMEWISSACA